MEYPVTLEPDDNDTLLVSFPDVPEAHTFGRTEEEALRRAGDVLETVLGAYIRDRQAIPTPSKVTGRSVTLPALSAMKVQLYEAMRQAGVTKAELARRLDVHMPQVDRLLDLRHGSKVDQLEAAAKALGGHLSVALEFPSGVSRRRLVISHAGRHATNREAKAAHRKALKGLASR
jgi:antitoxin HicB